MQIAQSGWGNSDKSVYNLKVCLSGLGSRGKTVPLQIH